MTSYDQANLNYRSFPAYQQQQQQQDLQQVQNQYSFLQGNQSPVRPQFTRLDSFNTSINTNPSTYGGTRNEPLSRQIKDLLKEVDQYIDRVEDAVNFSGLNKVRPLIPGIARFFIVATFFEDSIRILTQWKDQVFYLHKWRGYPWLFVVVFLFIVAVCMLVGGVLIILRRDYRGYVTLVLCVTILVQALVYGFFSGTEFLLRNFSVIGGLLISLSDSIRDTKASSAGLPELQNVSGRHKSYLLLAARILIVLMFIAFTIGKSWLTLVLTLVNTVCLAIGYRTRVVSLILGAILLFYNVYLNNYWLYDEPQRDYLRYEFYQTLSIIGGLLLVSNTGAGHISIDEKKKIY